MPSDASDKFLSGNPAGFMVDAIGRDLNPTAALNEYRENGGSFTTQSWYRLYGEVGASIENQTTAAGLDPYAVPNAGDYTEWSMGQGGGYATSVNVFFRDRDDGSIGYKQYDYITDEPHTPADAAAAAWDDYGDEETQNAYDQTLVGWSVRNVYQTVPWVGRDA